MVPPGEGDWITLVEFWMRPEMQIQAGGLPGEVISSRPELRMRIPMKWEAWGACLFFARSRGRRTCRREFCTQAHLLASCSYRADPRSWRQPPSGCTWPPPCHSPAMEIGPCCIVITTRPSYETLAANLCRLDGTLLAFLFSSPAEKNSK